MSSMAATKQTLLRSSTRSFRQGEDASPRVAFWLGVVSLSFVALGLGLRAYHYGRNPSVWHDEAALILNVISKSFAGLLGPLYFAEAGPPLFLWLERLLRLWLGDGVFALRLLPFLASCAALLMVACTACRCLKASAVPLAILFFACSRSLLWHASEAKPYAVDVALAALLPMLVCGPLRTWSLKGRLLFFTLLAPVGILLSYPGCFLMGGVALSLFPEVWRSGSFRHWVTFTGLLLTISGTFLLLLLGPIHAQRCPNMESCWLHAFAPWDKPCRLPVWIFSSLFGLTRYCLDPLGDVLILPAILGFVSLWKRGKGALVILLMAPIVLAFLAACAHAYPFDASRVIAFAAPALALGTAEGVVILAGAVHGWMLSGISSRQVWAGRFALATLSILVFLPLARALSDVANPWPRADVASAARFVLSERRPVEPVVGNHWEHAYYFRSLHEEFVFWDGRPLPDAGRVWLVITAGTEAENELLVAIALGNTWQTVREKRFEQCHALLLERIIPTPALALRAFGKHERYGF
jgi:hypothetical protein